MNRPSPCPYLPELQENLDWRHLHQMGGDRGATFYLRCLEYAQFLWMRATPARSLLAVDRALLSRIQGSEPEIHLWPLPYAAVAWIVTQAPKNLFLGNPRVHYQHLADRVRGPDSEIKRWRSWACWHLVCAVRHDLSGDPRHLVTPPARSAVVAGLDSCGIPGETEIWQGAFST